MGLSVADIITVSVWAEFKLEKQDIDINGVLET